MTLTVFFAYADYYKYHPHHFMQRFVKVLAMVTCTRLGFDGDLLAEKLAFYLACKSVKDPPKGETPRTLFAWKVPYKQTPRLTDVSMPQASLQSFVLLGSLSTSVIEMVL